MNVSQANSVDAHPIQTNETRDVTFGIYDILTDHGHCLADVVLAPAGEDGEPDWAKADPANVRALPSDEWPEDEPSARAACVLVSNVAGCDPDATFLIRLADGKPELIHIHGPESDRAVAESIIARDIGAEPPKREPTNLQKASALLRARLLSKPTPANDNSLSPSKLDSWGKLTFTWFDDIGTEAKKETVVKGMLGAGEFTMISGLPGSGKSVIVTDLACHIAAGLPWMGRKVKQGLVVYVAAERKKLTERRMMAFRKQHGVKDLPLLVLGGLIDMTTGTLHATAIAMAVKKAAERAGSGNLDRAVSGVSA
ncbi:AAA family ATPase [Bradyrhizobium sp. USDA 329]|uniref:AAA family ATPase n=1 Tax=unclassified Bradyrhizobium TaxID=2631580 RepID=UPI003516E558